LIIVFLLPRSYQVDCTCRRPYYLSWRISCAVTTELERLPTILQDALQLHLQHLKAPQRLLPIRRYSGIYKNPNGPNKPSRHRRKKSDVPSCFPDIRLLVETGSAFTASLATFIRRTEYSVYTRGTTATTPAHFLALRTF
jgi:hypothetical protein